MADSAGDPGLDQSAVLAEICRRIQGVLLARDQTLSTAESCTGGLIGHLLTEISGSSDYYVGGLISYSNKVKQADLGVTEQTIGRHGAVSAQTCVAMAVGAREHFRTSYAVAVTGIAGPSGGTDAKPVGLTYVAVADERGHDVRRFMWEGDRHANKLSSAGAALELLLERLDIAPDA